MFKADTTTLVENVLRDYPRARQDDKFLQLVVWQRQGLPITSIAKEMFLSKKIAAPESIRRTRQKIQESGRFLPSKPVQEARAELEKETRKEVTQAKLW